jgi:aromatic ring-opening dioxygenase catalytic subunit (LigB family)
MPALFIGHGSPMNTLERNGYTEGWRALALPTPDHFIPLLYVAGLAAQGGGAEALLRGCALGSISMTCYGVGVPRGRAE